jgi:hypothetical protein
MSATKIIELDDMQADRLRLWQLNHDEIQELHPVYNYNTGWRRDLKETKHPNWRIEPDDGTAAPRFVLMKTAKPGEYLMQVDTRLFVFRLDQVLRGNVPILRRLAHPREKTPVPTDGRVRPKPG